MAGAFQLTIPPSTSLGDMLKQQVEGSTDDERKRRMRLMQENQLLGPAGQLSVSSLLAPGGGKSAGY